MYLFADNESSKFHKQTFWRIFGDIAINNIRENLNNCTICPKCGAKIPLWSKSHICPKNMQGFYVCRDCGKICERINSRQVRCTECQEQHRYDMRHISKAKSKEARKERGRQFTTFLQSHYREM